MNQRLESDLGVLVVREEDEFQLVSLGDVRHVALSGSVSGDDEVFSVVPDSVDLQTVLGAAVGEDVAGIDGDFDTTGGLKFKIRNVSFV